MAIPGVDLTFYRLTYKNEHYFPLTKDLVLDTGRCGGWAAIIRDDLHCTYQGCGYGADTSANYVH